MDRAQDGPRQQRGLQCTFPIYGTESTGSCPASLLQEGLSWASSRYPWKNSAQSLWMRLPPCGDSFPLVLERLPRVSLCHERRDPDSLTGFPSQDQPAFSQRVVSKAGDGNRSCSQGLEAGGSMRCRSSSEAAFMSAEPPCSGEAGSPCTASPSARAGLPLTWTWNRRLSC